MYFEKDKLQGQQILETLAHELGHTADLEKAERMLKAVFHALRNRWDLKESLEFLALLPLPLKPFFIDGWRVHKTTPPFQHINDFLAEIMKEDIERVIDDFLTPDQTMVALQDIFRVIASNMDEEQKLEMETALPDVLQKVWEETVLA